LSTNRAITPHRLDERQARNLLTALAFGAERREGRAGLGHIRKMPGDVRAPPAKRASETWLYLILDSKIIVLLINCR
jgi:hypothetical protein